MLISQKLKPVANSSRRREYQLCFPFPAAQGFQGRENWPVFVSREYSYLANEEEYVAIVFKGLDRKRREVAMYVNRRNIPGNASEKMVAQYI
ncbi:hypothetical protein O181_014579 [Austropuccinia psidii MF-1]|uniref:Uncharacterized protein n=1 Tax=Austropuccinia psidii MF-1 TaxID=1389203 RepID=A0A9Q3GPZ7_9BASI|nr:hypothetical protein [Austropuccinia psidii MF-1]